MTIHHDPVDSMTYREALAYIESLEPRGWRLGLDRMHEFVRRAGLEGSLGEPEGPQFIHVAGTNGKGSVTAFLQSMLVEGGFRTGAFFSPYVFDPRERVQFGRDMISEADLAALTALLQPIGESLSETNFGGVTEFEFKTALGFLHWKRKKAEWVALEVGLGGRLDATNVVTPRAGVIVSIGLDHTAILGETHAKIAYEKAGIVKPGIPVVVGHLGKEALEVVERAARDVEAPIWVWGHDIEVTSRNGETDVRTPAGTVLGLTPGIPGAMQDHNLALAVAALHAAGVDVSPQAMALGAAAASIPGRFQVLSWRDRTVILDGAHNAEAAEVLMRSLRSFVKPDEQVTLVTGMVAGHDVAKFYKPLSGAVKTAHVAPIPFHRALPPATVMEALTGLIPSQAHDSMEAALEAAHATTQNGDVIVVTGSFYLVGEAGRALRKLSPVAWQPGPSRT